MTCTKTESTFFRILYFYLVFRFTVACPYVLEGKPVYVLMKAFFLFRTSAITHGFRYFVPGQLLTGGTKYHYIDY